MSPALLTLLTALLTVLTAIVAVLGAIACAQIRARTAREGYLTDLAREIIRRWHR